MANAWDFLRSEASPANCKYFGQFVQRKKTEECSIASNIRIRPKAVFAFSQPREQIANLRFFNSNASNFHPSTSRCTLEKQTLKIEDNSDGYIWALDSNSYQYTRFRGHVEKDLPTFKHFQDFICFCIRRLPYHCNALVGKSSRGKEVKPVDLSFKPITSHLPTLYEVTPMRV